MARKRKWMVRMAAAAFVFLLALAVIGFFLPQELLCVDSGPAGADVIVILGGGSGDRPARAAELFKQQAARRIIISGYGDSGINRRILLEDGVPAQAMEEEDRSRTTNENALFTIQMLRKEKVRRVILVTSWYHSRRALACFEHYAPEIEFYSRPSYFAYQRSDWADRKIEHRVYLEYPKLAGYWLRYGVRPF